MILARAIEHDGSAVAPGLGDFENARCRFAREQMPQMRFAVLRADERSVAHNHRQWRIDFAGDGHGEVVAATGDEGHLDATARRFGDRDAVRFRQLPLAVQKRAVNIQRDEAHGHLFIVA